MIDLPPREYRTSRGAYGDDKVAAVYCGFDRAPFAPRGEWQHGWLPPEYNVHPEAVVGGDGRSRERREWQAFHVARRDQEDCLRSQGYRRVHAIGLPVVYVERPDVERLPGSLLVMPVHSLPETREQWDEDPYANYVESIADRFESVVLCLHKTCVDKGHWLNGFMDRRITYVEGADSFDDNSMFRMARLLNGFEFVTSNGFGSHIAYAAYYGCKASVAGPRIRWKSEDHRESVLYGNAPELLDLEDEWSRTGRLDRAYPQFVVDPWEARPHREWAERQLGDDCRVSPDRLKALFGWDLTGRLSYPLRRGRGWVTRMIERARAV